MIIHLPFLSRETVWTKPDTTGEKCFVGEGHYKRVSCYLLSLLLSICSLVKAGTVCYGYDVGLAWCPVCHWLNAEGSCMSVLRFAQESTSPSLLHSPSLRLLGLPFPFLAPFLGEQTFLGTVGLGQSLSSRDHSTECCSLTQWALSRQDRLNPTGAIHSVKDFGQAIQSPSFYALTPWADKGRCQPRERVAVGKVGLFVLPDRCFIASDLVMCPSAIFSSLEHQLQPSYPMGQIKSMCTVPAWFFLLPWLGSGSSMR